jgi:HTH-type transcriptional regulator/antitoxin HigA
MWVLPAAAPTYPSGAAEFPPTQAAFETEPDLMSRAKSDARAGAVPVSYLALVKRHPLTSIRSENDLDAAQAVIDERLREELDDGRQAYLDALSDLVIVYEQQHHAVAPLPPHELLAHMLEERGMSQAELARMAGLAKATVSDLASGKRPFTVKHMHAVASIFGPPGSVFLPKTANQIASLPHRFVQK